MRYYSSTAPVKSLESAINSTATQIAIDPDLSGLPVLYPYTLVLNPDGTTEEIVTVTSLASGTTLNVTRGQDGSSAASHGAATPIKHMVTARDLQEPQTHMNASADVHGVTGELAGTADITAAINTHAADTDTHGATGAIVGTTNTQSLTNKTLSTGCVVPQSVVTNLVSDLAAKAPINAPTFTGTVVLPSTTSIGNVSSTEIGYLDGVTSAIQTQLNTISNDVAAIPIMRTGTATVTVGAGSSATTTVTFDTPFASGFPPTIILSLTSSHNFAVAVSSNTPTLSGFTFRGWGSTAATIIVNYLAVQI